MGKKKTSKKNRVSSGQTETRRQPITEKKPLFEKATIQVKGVWAKRKERREWAHGKVGRGSLIILDLDNGLWRSN